MAGTNPAVRQKKNEAASAAFQLGDEEDLAALAQLLEVPGLVVDLAVDRDGRLRFEMLAEPGIHLIERLDDVAQALRLDLELPPAAGIAAAEAARERYLCGRHQCRPRQSLLWSSAARIFGGDIGSSVRRRPIALSIALAIAAIGGQILTSPTPLAPYGCAGFGTSTRIGSIIGMSEATGTR